MSDSTLPISGFIQAMAKRFQDRTLMGELSCIGYAVQSLDAWETVFKEPVELTEECAHAIVDSELEHWESD